MDKKVKTEKDPRIRDAVWNDIKHGNLGRGLMQDLRDLYEFYIDPQTHEKYQRMGRFKRWLNAAWRILKMAILRLTPARRILLLISLVLVLSGSTSYSTQPDHYTEVRAERVAWGYALLFLVLLLELKDKLLARDELETGRRVQLALIPKEQPSIPGWDVWMMMRPANDVGGDLIDYLQIDNKRHGLSIGDVAGKGLGAALFMSRLQATIRALAPIRTNLVEFGTELNRIFYRDSLPNRFASLVYILLSEDGEVELLNAGHLPPLVLKGGRIREMSGGQPALGMLPKIKYKTQSVDMKAGDFLFLYSDGLTDAQNKQGDFFGEERIKKRVERFHNQTAESSGRQILAAAELFIGDRRLNDDLSLIVIRRKG